MSFLPNIVIMCFAPLLCLSGDAGGERKQRCSEAFAVSVTLPHLTYQTVATWFHSSAFLRFVISSCLLKAWACFLFLALVVFICLSLFACALEVKKGITPWFAPLPPTPHLLVQLHLLIPTGKDAAIEPACQCERSAALHAVFVLLVSGGIMPGEPTLWQCRHG